VVLDAGQPHVEPLVLERQPPVVDMPPHSDFLLLKDGDVPSKIRQGVTTEVLGEGSQAGPLASAGVALLRPGEEPGQAAFAEPGKALPFLDDRLLRLENPTAARGKRASGRR
jgi:hypothetical protein